MPGANLSDVTDTNTIAAGWLDSLPLGSFATIMAVLPARNVKGVTNICCGGRMRFKAACMLIGPICLPAMSQAQENLGQLEEVPINWRMQDYIPGTVHIYYTSSSCGSGAFLMMSGDSDADKDRLWSLVLTAKAARKKVGIYYDKANNCRILSFYTKEGE